MRLRRHMAAACTLHVWIAAGMSSVAEQLVFYDFEQSSIPAATAEGVVGSEVCSLRGPWYLWHVSDERKGATRSLPPNGGGTLELTISASERRTLSVAAIGFLCDISDGTTRAWSLRSSVDNYAGVLATGITANAFAPVAIAFAEIANVSYVTFRLSVEARATFAQWRVDDLAVYGTATAAYPAPTGLVTSEVTWRDFRASWDAIPDAAGYWVTVYVPDPSLPEAGASDPGVTYVPAFWIPAAFSVGPSQTIVGQFLTGRTFFWSVTAVSATGMRGLESPIMEVTLEDSPPSGWVPRTPTIQSITRHPTGALSITADVEHGVVHHLQWQVGGLSPDGWDSGYLYYFGITSSLTFEDSGAHGEPCFYRVVTFPP